MDADSIQQNSIFNSYESLPGANVNPLIKKKTTNTKTISGISNKDLINNISSQMLGSSSSQGADPLDADAKLVIMSGEQEETEDSFSEHDSIDSFEQITIQAKKEDADKATKFYATLGKY